MIRNFLTVAWRNLLKNKVHSLINITGLAIGISSCLVIYLIVSFELSFNKGFPGYDQIYRLHSSFGDEENSGVATAVGDAVQAHIKGIAHVTSIYSAQLNVLIPGTSKNLTLERVKGIIFTDSSFFHVFNAYTWLAGSAKELDKPFTVVLTESRAKTYFGTTDAHSLIGKEIVYHDSVRTTVGGIVKDLPFNSDLDFTEFISTATIRSSKRLQGTIRLDNWHYEHFNNQAFIRIDDHSDFTTIQNQLPILDKLYKDHSATGNPHFSNNKHKLQRLSDLHFNADLGIFGHSRTPAHLPTLRVLSAIAVLLLLMGSVNFINLETARAFHRAKEVGVRKVLGSTQRTLIIQFLTESFIITVSAILLALPLCELALNTFHEFIPAGVELNLVRLIFPLVILLVIVSLLAGLYPAFVLSSFMPAKVLKRQISFDGKSGVSMRKALTVFQFSFAQALIIVTLIVGWQLDFLRTKDLGFTKDAIVYFFAPDPSSDPKILKTELEKISEIEQVSLSGTPPSYRSVSYTYIYHHQGAERIETEVSTRTADSDFLNVYDIQLLAGENLLPNDTAHEVLINETLLRKLGFEHPIEAIGYPVENHNRTLIVKGVVKNFHIESLHTLVEPLVLLHSQNSSCLNIKLIPMEKRQLSGVMRKIEKAWKTVYPEHTLKVSFLDESLNNFYQAEQRTSKLVTTAASMAIFISCLGLWGLASFAAVQRTKEIGIRKILGATGRVIVALLSKDFVVLVLMAFAIACPVAWMVGDTWLKNFAYHIEVNGWIFLVTIAGSLCIMFVTIGYQTIKAATTNPVNSLRNE